VTVVLYRPSLDARSGAGQLLEMQWRGLVNAGVPAIVAGRRGVLRFWWRTGVRARRWSVAHVERMAESGATVVDHGLSLPSAELVFVHNLSVEAGRHVTDARYAEAARHEREFFGALGAATTVVANSKLVASALLEHFGVARERVTVLYPGFKPQRFSPQRAAELRGAARRSLEIEEGTPLVGFVTSGDFAKRGLDLFLDCAARIAGTRPDVRFLVVGSKELPQYARDHTLARGGALTYRPKGARVERWFAALDLFLYAARFEEFGMVVAEAQAMGVPVLTSRLVGASECLPEAYTPWLLDRPEPQAMTERALELLADAELRNRLSAAAAVSVTAFADRAYAEGTRRLLGTQNRRVR
jgi:glycosyltransferase involved in cell wall biosynthesis